jgi:hypothetical protein
MDQENKKIPIRIDLSPDNIEILNNDIKRLNDCLEKSCKSGVFSLKESQLVCTSLENFASLVLLISQSVQQTLEKMQEMEKKMEQLKNEVGSAKEKSKKIIIKEVEQENNQENNK